MTLLRPAALLGLPLLLGLLWLIAHRGRPTVAPRRRRISFALRSLVVGLLVLAVADPVLPGRSTDRSVLFLVDRSASVSPAARAAQEDYLAAALAEAGPKPRSGVVVFGRDVAVDLPLAQDRRPRPIRAAIDDSATDLASALRATAALLPSAGSRRIVLLTDGLVTGGGTRAAIEDLAALGIAVDVVTLPTARGRDAAVLGVEAPATARVDELLSTTVRVAANEEMPAELVVRIGEEIQRSDVVLEAGTSEFTFTATVPDLDVVDIDVEVHAEGDVEERNDVGRAIVGVVGTARVAVVEGKRGEGTELAAALEAAGFAVTRSGRIPTAERLSGLDALVLVDVPAPPAEEVDRIADFVEVLGRGLVVVGGDQAFGMGDYSGSALEELLPVRSDPDDLVRRQPVAEVLLIDTSGSMANCHCRDGEFSEGGVNKTDLSRAGAAKAIEALADTDRVGVLAFDSGTDWIIPLGPKPDPEVAGKALESLQPLGETTAIARGLAAALEELRDAPEQIRHVVLFTDGWDPNEGGLLDAVRELADQGITLSVLGTGEGPGVTLRRMAEIGGGRYYHGADLEEIPEIFVEETMTVARNVVQEGRFRPLLNGASPLTEDLTATPPLRGYVLTTPKVAAAVPLLVSAEEDPLLATWRRGLGKVTAWTSDATARWSVDWVAWDGFAPFWVRVVDDVIPEQRDRAPEVRIEGGSMRIRFDVDDPPDDATAIASVRGPDGTTKRFPLFRSGLGVFEAETPVATEGVYWVSVAVEGRDGVVAAGATGAVLGYPIEFSPRTPDPTLLATITETTGGRLDPEPSRVFDPAPVSTRTQGRIWPWLATAALLAFLADVAVRRIDLGVPEPTARPPAGPPPPEPSSAEADVAAAAAPSPARPETLNRLLERKRKRRR